MTPRPRRRPALLGALLGAALALAACEDGQPNRDPLRVRTPSGGTVDLTGTEWRGCFPVVGGGSEGLREVHGEEGAVTFTFTPYGTGDCTGAAAAAPESFGVIASGEGNVQVGWAGGAPPSGSALAETVVATKVVLYLGDGTWDLDVYLVDDTPTPRVLYTGDPASRIAAGEYPTRLLVQGEREE